MKNDSLWSDFRYKEDGFKEKKFINDIECDNLIIGGGITGVSCGYFLKDSKEKTILIDRGRIGNGITKKTTAKITYLQDIIYQTLEKNFNKEIAYEYYKSQIRTIKLIEDIIEKIKIDCDFKHCDSVIFTLKKEGIRKIDKEKELLSDFGSVLYDVNNDSIVKGIKIKDSYMFNPLKFIDGIIDKIRNKINIYEGVMAKNIVRENDKYVVKTSKGLIKAKRVIVACHYPFFLVPGMFPIKTYVKREYVNAAKTDNIYRYMAISIDKELHSIRYYKDYLIYGSNSHRITNKIDYKKNYDKSRDDFYKYFDKKPNYTWMNQDIMSNDSLPFIGEIKDNLYVSLGYNAWGMTNGVLGGKIIAELIMNGENEFAELFNPKRLNIPLVINSMIGSLCYLKGYVEGLFKKNNLKYVKIKGIWYGIYIDENGLEHVVKLLCPHMKCFLIFNREENTWDCPCHGSRFDIDGNVILGPSNMTIKKDN